MSAAGSFTVNLRAAEAGRDAHRTAPATWPFTRDPVAAIPADARIVYAPRLHEAFPSGQRGGTRLVLTQSSYQVQRWLDWLDAHPAAAVVADTTRDALTAAAPEWTDGRGPWSRVTIVEPQNDAGARDAIEAPQSPAPLARAFIVTNPDERLALCRRAADAAPDDVVAQLALGSAYMEVQDLDASQTAIERAIQLDFGWEAAHYELGKLFLRRDNLERASLAFAAAGRLMPSFSAAFSNLGATLGELDRPDEALAAFRQALQYDPNGYTVLNNIGVVLRELGRLPESEAAFRRVLALAPQFVFGHYNLGHTLFLQGRYEVALSAYMEGQRRDPEKNARQACRLAVVRLATGDAEGALRDVRSHTLNLPAPQKREILAEVQEILWALLTDRPALPGWRKVADAVKAELERE